MSEGAETEGEYLDIPEQDLKVIDQEVADAIDPIREEDPDSAELMEIYLRDHKISTYNFLKWVDREFNPERVLYPASGFDKLPKAVFGENRVLHTSLEEFNTGVADAAYFPELGSGAKVTADNASLPFADGSFNAITIFGIPENVPSQFQEFERVLKNGGIITFTRQTHEMIADGEAEKDEETLSQLSSGNLERQEVPTDLQLQGESQTEFFVFKKR